MKDGRVTQRIEAPAGKKPLPIDLIEHMM